MRNIITDFGRVNQRSIEGADKSVEYRAFDTWESSPCCIRYLSLYLKRRNLLEERFMLAHQLRGCSPSWGTGQEECEWLVMLCLQSRNRER